MSRRLPVFVALCVPAFAQAEVAVGYVYQRHVFVVAAADDKSPDQPRVLVAPQECLPSPGGAPEGTKQWTMRWRFDEPVSAARWQLTPTHLRLYVGKNPDRIETAFLPLGDLPLLDKDTPGAHALYKKKHKIAEGDDRADLSDRTNFVGRLPFHRPWTKLITGGDRDAKDGEYEAAHLATDPGCETSFVLHKKTLSVWETRDRAYDGREVRDATRRLVSVKVGWQERFHAFTDFGYYVLVTESGRVYQMTRPELQWGTEPPEVVAVWDDPKKPAEVVICHVETGKIFVGCRDTTAEKDKEHYILLQIGDVKPKPEEFEFGTKTGFEPGLDRVFRFSRYLDERKLLKGDPATPFKDADTPFPKPAEKK